MSAKRRRYRQPSITKDHYQEQLKRITFFLERSLGGKAILEALRNADLQVEPHSKWFRHNTPDQDWLPIVGEKKWIVLMRDKAIGKRYLELNALLRSKVKAFVLVTGELSEQVSAEIIKKAVPKIVEMIEQNDSHLSRRFIRIAQWNCGELKCSLSKGFN